MATLQQTTASRPELPDPKLPLAQTTAQSAAQSFRMGAQMSLHQHVINTAAYVALRGDDEARGRGPWGSEDEFRKEWGNYLEFRPDETPSQTWFRADRQAEEQATMAAASLPGGSTLSDFAAGMAGAMIQPLDLATLAIPGVIVGSVGRSLHASQAAGRITAAQAATRMDALATLGLYPNAKVRGAVSAGTPARAGVESAKQVMLDSIKHQTVYSGALYGMGQYTGIGYGWEDALADMVLSPVASLAMGVPGIRGNMRAARTQGDLLRTVDSVAEFIQTGEYARAVNHMAERYPDVQHMVEADKKMVDTLAKENPTPEDNYFVAEWIAKAEKAEFMQNITHQALHKVLTSEDDMGNTKLQALERVLRITEAMQSGTVDDLPLADKNFLRQVQDGTAGADLEVDGPRPLGDIFNRVVEETNLRQYGAILAKEEAKLRYALNSGTSPFVLAPLRPHNATGFAAKLASGAYEANLLLRPANVKAGEPGPPLPENAVIYVSVPGASRGYNFNPEAPDSPYGMVPELLRRGNELITDTEFDARRSQNASGEGKLRDYLQSQGAHETVHPGVRRPDGSVARGFSTWRLPKARPGDLFNPQAAPVRASRLGTFEGHDGPYLSMTAPGLSTLPGVRSPLHQLAVLRAASAEDAGIDLPAGVKEALHNPVASGKTPMDFHHRALMNKIPVTPDYNIRAHKAIVDIIKKNYRADNIFGKALLATGDRPIQDGSQGNYWGNALMTRRKALAQETATPAPTQAQAAPAQPAASSRSYGRHVSRLEPNQVFVFGSNLQGFHGAGSAGYAMRGTSKNTWRQDQTFLSAMQGGDKQGKWAVYGQGEGLQKGKEGQSYALPTVTKAGAKRSRTPEEITASIAKMYQTARENPGQEFLVAGGTEGRLLNGYSHEDMVRFYQDAGPIPENVRFSDSYAAKLGLEGKAAPTQAPAAPAPAASALPEALQGRGIIPFEDVGGNLVNDPFTVIDARNLGTGTSDMNRLTVFVKNHKNPVLVGDIELPALLEALRSPLDPRILWNPKDAGPVEVHALFKALFAAKDNFHVELDLGAPHLGRFSADEFSGTVGMNPDRIAYPTRPQKKITEDVPAAKAVDTVVHELTHALAYYDPELYQRLSEYVRSNETWFNAVAAEELPSVKAHYHKGRVEFEMTARLVSAGSLFPTFWQGFFDQMKGNPSLTERFRMWFRSFFRALRDALDKGHKPYGLKPAEVDSFVRELGQRFGEAVQAIQDPQRRGSYENYIGAKKKEAGEGNTAGQRPNPEDRADYELDTSGMPTVEQFVSGEYDREGLPAYFSLKEKPNFLGAGEYPPNIIADYQKAHDIGQQRNSGLPLTDKDVLAAFTDKKGNRIGDPLIIAATRGYVNGLASLNTFNERLAQITQTRMDSGLRQMAHQERIEAGLISRVQDKDPRVVGKRLLGLMDGVNRKDARSQASVDVAVAQRITEDLNTVVNVLTKHGILDLFNGSNSRSYVSSAWTGFRVDWENPIHRIAAGQDPTLNNREVSNRFVTDIMEAYRTGEIPEQWRSVPAFKETVDAIRTLREKQAADLNRVGGYLGEAYDYDGISQRWDSSTILHKGQSHFIRRMMGLVDWEGTERFHGYRMDREQFLGAWYEGLEADLADRSSGNLADTQIHRSLSKSRMIAIRPEARAEAMLEFSGHDHLGRLLMDQVRYRAESIAVMEQLGVNPQATLDNLLATSGYRSQAPEGLTKEYTLWQLQGMLDLMTNVMDNPVNLHLGHFSKTFRQVSNLAFLPQAGISALTDVPLIASSLRSAGVDVGYFDRDFALNYRDALMRGLRGDESTTRQALLGAGAGMVAFTNAAARRVSVGSDGTGNLISRANEWLFNANFLNTVTTAGQEAFVDALSQALAQGDSFTPALVNAMRNFGFNDADIAGFRSGIGEVDGVSRLLPQSIEDPQLRKKLMSYFMHYMRSGVVEPDAGGKVLVRMGLPAGTWGGEAIRSVFQYMSFPLSISRQVHMRMAAEYANGDMGRSQLLANVTGYLAAAMAMGYVSSTLKDMAMLREPMFLHNMTAKGWLRVVELSGVGGALEQVLDVPVAPLPQTLAKVAAAPFQERKTMLYEGRAFTGSNYPVVGPIIQHILAQPFGDSTTYIQQRMILNNWWETELGRSHLLSPR